MKTFKIWKLVRGFLVAACLLTAAGLGTSQERAVMAEKEDDMAQSLSTAVFAGGCFWCVESAFEGREGITDVVSGYMGGQMENPTYEEVCSGTTGHAEVVQVTFDPQKISYWDLLGIFFKQIDPTDASGSFVDRGSQYRSAIFCKTPEQERLAHAMIARLNDSRIFNRPLATEVSPATTFYPAEDYHQDYHKNNPIRYKFYRNGSGRDRFITSFWEKGNQAILEEPPPVNSPSADGPTAFEPAKDIPGDQELKTRLTDLQYSVTRENKTEPPFRNEYWDNKKAGIYVDLISGIPLFSSRDKFDSGTGWPSFTRPLDPDELLEVEDTSLLMKRVEVRAKRSDAHLGHLFTDGPAPTGLRYCMNSAALRFIPRERLDSEGYGYLKDGFSD